MEHGPKSIAPKACLYLFTNCEVNNTNGFRFLPVDMRAVLLLVVIFMRLAAETAWVVPELLRTLVFARPCGGDQFAAGTVSPSLDMSR